MIFIKASTSEKTHRQTDTSEIQTKSVHRHDDMKVESSGETSGEMEPELELEEDMESEEMEVEPEEMEPEMEPEGAHTRACWASRQAVKPLTMCRASRQSVIRLEMGQTMTRESLKAVSNNFC